MLAAAAALVAKIALAAVFAGVGTAYGQETMPGLPVVPLGYCQITAAQLESAVGLSSCTGGIPLGATMVTLQAETADVRYRDDGTAPTASAGMLVVSGTSPSLYTGTLSTIRFIAASGSPVLNVAFYR